MKNYFKKLKLIDRVLWVVIAIGFVFCSYAAFIEPFQLKITEQTITTSKWTNKAPLKIAILTDTHAITPWMTPSHLQDIVDKTNALEPDIIVLLGDYVGSHPFGLQVKPEDGVAPFKNLKAACDVYAVLGNHDWIPNIGWPDAMLKTGLPVLQNDAINVDCHGDKFWVAGLGELWIRASNLDETMKKVTNDDPVVMLMHNPDSFAIMPPHVTLSLAGHTHGGQIRLPFIGAVAAVIPSKYGDRYAYGHINENGNDLFVSRGLGMTGLPLRFLAPPEVALITLKSP